MFLRVWFSSSYWMFWSEMPDLLGTPLWSLINVFLILIFTPNGVSTRLKFKFDLFIWVKITSQVWFGSIVGSFSELKLVVVCLLILTIRSVCSRFYGIRLNRLENTCASAGGRFWKTPHLEAKKGFIRVWFYRFLFQIIEHPN